MESKGSLLLGTGYETPAFINGRFPGATIVPGTCWRAPPGGSADLRFYKNGVFQHRAGPSGTTNTSLREVATSAGTLRFDADYYGVDPLIDVTLLEIDLPYL